MMILRRYSSTMFLHVGGSHLVILVNSCGSVSTFVDYDYATFNTQFSDDQGKQNHKQQRKETFVIPI
jgi:hypothetical protein